MPKFFPGDVVKTAAGGIGLIVQAQVIINGSKIDWNGKLPDKIEHGWPPSYALDAIPGFPRPHKYAWWTASEWIEVMRGPLHAILSVPNS